MVVRSFSERIGCPLTFRMMKSFFNPALANAPFLSMVSICMPDFRRNFSAICLSISLNVAPRMELSAIFTTLVLPERFLSLTITD